MGLDQDSQNKAASNEYEISYGEKSGLNRKKKKKKPMVTTMMHMIEKRNSPCKEMENKWFSKGEDSKFIV